jgi:hypothetical protein
VRRNNGDRTFTLAPAAGFRSAAGAEWRVLVGDFNGDRRADVADLHVPSASVWIHLGTGAPAYDFGRQDAGYARMTAGSDWRVIAGDFTGDGRADLADLHLPSGQLWAHEALGGGGFSPGNSAFAQTSRGGAGWQLVGE